MKQLVRLPVLGLFLVLAAATAAQEPPHLKLIEGLRARNYPDLALEYLEKLQKKPPADIAAILPLEFGKIRLDLATASSDDNERLSLFAKARQDVEEFTRKNPQHPRVAEARLEILARIAILQARLQLAQARRQDSPEERRRDAQSARELFVEAGGQIQKAAEELDAQISRGADDANPKKQSEKLALIQTRRRAELEQALNYLDRAQTYLDRGNDDVLIERSEEVKKAVPILEKLSEGDGADPMTWEAKAWLGRCRHENGAPKDARAVYQEIISDPRAVVSSGKRLARYFRILVVVEYPEPDEQKVKDSVIRDAAERWCKDYPRYLQTAEGCGVRFQLVQAYVRLAQAARNATIRKELLQQALAQCEGLEETENDYTADAHRLKGAIYREQGSFKENVARLTRFQDCILRSEYEAEQMSSAGAAKNLSENERKKRREEHFQLITQSLEKALQLAKAGAGRATPRDVALVQARLAGYYLFAGKYRQAIEAGREAALRRPANSQTGLAATYVLQAYLDLILSGLAKGDTLEDLDKERTEFRKLAQYMETTWPREPAGDRARHQRGLLLMREKNFPEAVEALASVSPNYAGIIFVKAQLAQAAFQAEQDKTPPAGRDKRSYQERAVEALQTLPPLPADAAPATTAIYLQAKIDLGKALYTAKKFDDALRMVEPLLARMPDLKFDGPARQEAAQTELLLLQRWAEYGKADAAYSEGKILEAKAAVDAIVQKVKAGQAQEFKKAPTLRWGVMDLALRMMIGEGDMGQAREILEAFQKLRGDDEAPASAEIVLQRLAAMMRSQVRTLRRGKAAPEEAAKTIDNFALFVDSLANQEKKPSPQYLRVLGLVYDGLGKHEKAAEFLQRVQEPKAEMGRPPDPKLAQNYQACRTFLIRQLRLSGKLDEAESLRKELQKTPWGKTSLELQKEEILLLMARQKYAPAYKQWNYLVSKQLLPKVSQDPRIKAQYFECYCYLVETLYKYALAKIPAGPKRDATVERAANLIVRLENNWPDLGGADARARFEDLLDREPVLKEAFDKIKGSK